MAKTKPPTDPTGADAPDDMDLWTEISGSVRPMEDRETLPPGVSEKPSALTSGLSSGKAPPRPRAETPPPPVPLTPQPELSHENQPGLDKATARRLARGKAKIEARLDLHGMTQAQAAVALEDFIERTQRQGKREVIVVTGKGTRTDGSIGVLRQMVPDWLNRQPNRSRIVAFTYAAPKDGGEGALYVRLKKLET